MLSVLHSHYFADTYPDEWDALSQVFPSHHLSSELSDFPTGSVVLPRYRAIPFGDGLETEATALGMTLINTWKQHQALDNLLEWSSLLGDMTARTYTLEDFDTAPNGPYFVKGEVNSMKNRGPEKAFANNKSEALSLAKELSQDSWLDGQTIVLRELQDYLRLGATKTHNLPVFHEQRVFIYRSEVLSVNFYWGTQYHLVSKVPQLGNEFYQAIDKALSRIGHLADFLVLDMAQYTDGHWGVVELNDACMSGIPSTSTHELFGNLWNQFTG